MVLPERCIDGILPKDTKTVQKLWRTFFKQLVRDSEENAQQTAVGQVGSTNMIFK